MHPLLCYNVHACACPKQAHVSDQGSQASASYNRQDYRSAALQYTAAISAASEVVDTTGSAGMSNTAGSGSGFGASAADAGHASQLYAKALQSRAASDKRKLVTLYWNRSAAWVSYLTCHDR